jgi:hypothetical protein
MDSQLFIVLYSKYSINSQKLLQLLKDAQINFQTLCIDNKLIRKKILESTKIKIIQVPSILIVYPTGGVEQYDGENAFIWVYNIIEKIQKENKPEQPQTNDFLNKKIISESPEKCNSENEENEEKPKKIKIKKKNNKTVRFENKTNISKLLDEDENIEENDDNNNNLFDDNPNLENIINKGDNKKSASNIMAAAMEMQKMREKEVETEKKQIPPSVLSR